MKLAGSEPFPEDPATIYHHVPFTSGLVVLPFLSDTVSQVPGVMSPGQLKLVWLSLIIGVHRWNLPRVILWRLQF